MSVTRNACGIWIVLFFGCLALTATAAEGEEPFEPTWESLNTRTVPGWFADAKFGIFIHWGVYSVPAYCHTSTYSEWYLWWLKTNAHDGMERRFHESQYGKDFHYRQFAPMFRAELFDPDQWAELFRRAGARYVVLTSKHHDGFCLWPSREASRARGYPWNSCEVGPKRDLVGDLTRAVRDKGLRMGLYYSFMEWENPLFDSDRRRYVEEVMFPQMREIVLRYQPDVFWPDGEWNHPDTEWRSTEFLAWLFNKAPNRDELVVNDRWGKGLRGRSGDYYTTEYGHHAGAGATSGSKPFEECRGIGGSFAFNRLENYDHYSSRTECVRLLVELVSRGGGLLLDIGPTADGRIPVIMQDRLIAMGRWLEVNGDSIYGADRSLFRFLPWGASTTKGRTIYLHVYGWPPYHKIQLQGLKTPVKRAYMLADPSGAPIEISGKGPEGITLNLLGRHPDPHATVIALELDGDPEVDNSIFPLSDGSIRLRPEMAELEGGVRLESAKGTGRDWSGRNDLVNVGYWSNPRAVVAWDVTSPADRKYQVEIVLACKPGCEGGEFLFEMEGQSLKGTIEKHTGGWQSYIRMPLGTITTGRSERKRAQLSALKIPGEALMNVRMIHLEPVE